MRSLMLAAAAAITLFGSPASAQFFEIGPGGIRFDDGRTRMGGRCERLRLACENKDRLGERGEGNCRRFRQECGAPRPSRAMCQELRNACLYKDELGERGEGNCRRYRQVCRGRG